MIGHNVPPPETVKPLGRLPVGCCPFGKLVDIQADATAELYARSIAELEEHGYTSLGARCANERCRNLVYVPFRMLKERNRAKGDTMIGDIARRYVCNRCKGHELAEPLESTTQGKRCPQSEHRGLSEEYP